MLSPEQHERLDLLEHRVRTGVRLSEDELMEFLDLLDDDTTARRIETVPVRGDYL